MNVNLVCFFYIGFQDVRDLHISSVHSILVKWYAELERTQTDLQTKLKTNSSFDFSFNLNDSNSLKYLGNRIRPLLASKNELTFLSVCLDRILNEMTQKQSVEDLRTAQTMLLQSGSGNSLAINQSNNQISETKKLYPISPGGASGNLFDDLFSMPVRLAIEWLTVK